MTREDRGASSFDELAVGLSSGTLSRGKALRLMGAALLGGTLASLGIGEAGADDLCKPEGKKCRKDAQCCSGNCVDRKCGEAISECTRSEQACAEPFFCGPENNCCCFKTTEGGTRCSSECGICPTQTCNSSNECPADFFCALSCCTEAPLGVCVASCGTALSAGLQESGGGSLVLSR